MKKLLTLTSFLLLALFSPLSAQQSFSAEWLSIRLKTGSQYDGFWPLDNVCAKVTRKGLFGLLDKSGKEICPPQFDEIGWGNGPFYAVKKKGLFGAVNARGELVVPFIYKNLKASGNGFAAMKDSLWGVFDADGQQILPFQSYNEPQMDTATIVADIDRVHYGAWDWSGRPLLPARYHALEHQPAGGWDATWFGKHGFITEDGRDLDRYIYQRVFGLPGGAYIGEKNGGEFDVFDGKGTLISNCVHAYSVPAGHGWYVVYGALSVWVVDTAGIFHETPGNFQIESCGDCPEGFFTTTLNYDEGSSMLGWYNIKTNQSIDPQFFGLNFQNDVVIALGDTNSGKYNLEGRLLEKLPFSVLPNEYTWPFYIFQKDGHQGAMDSNLQIILPAMFDDIDVNGGGFIVRKGEKGEKAGYYDQKGREIVPIQYDQVSLDASATFFSMVKDGLIGVLDIDGKMLLQPEYSNLISIGNGSFLAIKQGKYGLVSKQGEILLPIQYTQIQPYYSGVSMTYLLLQSGDKYGWIDALGHEILPPEYNSIQCAFNTLITCKNGQYGLRDMEGKVLLPATHSVLSYRSIFLVAKKKDKFGVYSTAGQVLLPFEYDTMYTEYIFLKALKNGKKSTWRMWNSELIEGDFLEKQFAIGLYIQSKNGKKGLYDLNGEILWPPVYDDIIPTQYGEAIAIARKDGNWQLLNAEGESLFSFQADTLYPYPQDRFIYFLRDGQKMVLDLGTHLERSTMGLIGFGYYPGMNMILGAISEGRYRMFDTNLEPLHPDMTLSFWENAYVRQPEVWRNGKKGLMGHDGTILVQPEYDEVYFLTDSLIIIANEGKKGLLDLRNNRQLPMEYDDISVHDLQPWIMAKKDSLKGYFDYTLSVQIPVQYTEIYALSDQVIQVQKNGLWGLINRQGEIILPVQYTRIEQDYESYNEESNPNLHMLRIYQNDLVGLAMPDGKIVLPVEYSNVYADKYFFYGFNPDNSRYIFNRKGKLLYHFSESRFVADNTPFVILCAQGNCGVLDTSGHWLLPMEYEEIENTGHHFLVQKDSKCGVFQMDGKVLLPVEHEHVAPPYDGSPYFFLWNKGKAYYFADEKRQFSPDAYDFADPFVNGYAAVRKQGKWGYLDSTGQLAIPLQFDYAEPFHRFNGSVRAVVYQNNDYYFIDSLGFITGEYTAPTDKSQAYFYRPVHVGQDCKRLLDGYGRQIFASNEYNIKSAKAGLVVFYAPTDKSSYHYTEGLMDFTGRVIAQAVYNSINSYAFSHADLVPVSQNGKYGFINRHGAIVIPFQYDEAHPFCEMNCDPDALARVRIGTKYMNIDKRGKCVSGCE